MDILAAALQLTFYVIFIGTQNMLSHIAPAVLAARFVRVIRIAQAARHVNRLAPQMDAGRMLDGLRYVVLLLKRHA
jgi:hypothetical protein